MLASALTFGLLEAKGKVEERPRAPEQRENDAELGASGLRRKGTGTSLSSSGGSSQLERSTIYLHFEVLAPRAHKLAQAVFLLLILSGIALIAVVFYLRMQKDDSRYLASGVLFKLHAAFAAVGLALLLPMLGWFSRAIWATRASPWTRRQRYIVTLVYLEVAVQCTNLAFWLLPNAYLLARPCDVFAPLLDACVYVRWTCWNLIFFLQLVHTHNCMPALTRACKRSDYVPDRGNPRYGCNDRDPMLLDAPFLATHWKKIAYLIMTQAAILFLPCSGGIDWRPQPQARAAPGCSPPWVHSQPGVRYTVVRSLWGAAVISYQAATQTRLRLALARLQTQPYNTYQFAHLLLLWQKRLTIWMELLGMVDVSLTYFSYSNLICYLLQWTGQVPLQVLVTVGVLLNAFYFAPSEPGNEQHAYQAWLQDFAWTAGQVRRRRAALLARSPSLGPALLREPLFCMETALKLVLWSNLVYEDAAEGRRPGLAAALRGRSAKWDSLVGPAELPGDAAQPANGAAGAADELAKAADGALELPEGSRQPADSALELPGGERPPAGAAQPANGAVGAANGGASELPGGERQPANGLAGAADAALELHGGGQEPLSSAAEPAAGECGQQGSSPREQRLGSSQREQQRSSQREQQGSSEEQPEGRGLSDASAAGSSAEGSACSAAGQAGGEEGSARREQDEAGSDCRSGVSERRLKGETLAPEQPGHTALKVEDDLSGPEALELAMRMYGLQELVVIHGKATDTKAVVAWSGKAMVLAFRGTNSLRNVRSDARAWRAPHPPVRGRLLLGTRPLVHRGFLGAWAEVRAEVLARAGRVLAAASVPLVSFQVFVTGHSLGGALATLAAFELQRCRALPRLACYTFGAPRTGNTAFADEFGRLVPDCWHVINDRDAVPRTGKMVWLYKRPGERVLLNQRGDIRVRPTVFEVNLHTQGFSIRQHMLAAYLGSLGSVCAAQLLRYKQVEGGAAGVRRLARDPDVSLLLASIGFDLQKLASEQPLEIARLVGGGKRRRCPWDKSLLEVVRDLQPVAPAE